MNSQITVSTSTINVTDTNIQANDCIGNTQSINAVEDKGNFYVAAVVGLVFSSSTIFVRNGIPFQRGL